MITVPLKHPKIPGVKVTVEYCKDPIIEPLPKEIAPGYVRLCVINDGNNKNIGNSLCYWEIFLVQATAEGKWKLTPNNPLSGTTFFCLQKNERVIGCTVHKIEHVEGYPLAVALKSKIKDRVIDTGLLLYKRTLH